MDTPTRHPAVSQDTPTVDYARATDTPTGDHARTTDTPTGQDEADIILEVLENMHIDGGSGKSPSKVGTVVTCVV
jgi:hypothetical protein